MGSPDTVNALVISTQDILLVILIAVLLFGGKKIADIGKGLGEGIRNFRDTMKGDGSNEGKKQQ